MTAIRRRRTRSTVLAFVASVVGLATVAVLGLTGVETLWNSTAGQRAAVDSVATATLRLPSTATALVGVVDDDGRLTSTVVLALEPDGTGGSIVVVAASADAGSGATGELVPLDARLAVDGGEGYRQAVEQLTGLSFDVLEIVDDARLAELVAPLGDLAVTLPVGARDASTGEQWEAGEVVLASPEAARVLTASDPAVPDWYYEPSRTAVWSAIADRVGAGIGSAEPVADDESLPPVATLDEFVDRLFAGPVTERDLGFRPIGDRRVGNQLRPELVDAFGAGVPVDVVVHDRAELLMFLGAVAPARLGAPLEAPSVRVVSGFDDDELAELGLGETDVVKWVLDRLIFGQVNIVSVAVLPGQGVPETTEVRVADGEVIDAVDEIYGDLLGPVEVRPADAVIEGVDIEIVVGTSVLTELAAADEA